MQVYKITGQVTLCRVHPSFIGGRLLTAESHAHELLGLPANPEGDTVVVWDDLGAYDGALVAVSDGAEAAQPFRPAIKPVDAYCAAILDEVSIQPSALQRLELKK